jgi:hypothetical protein
VFSLSLNNFFRFRHFFYNQKVFLASEKLKYFGYLQVVLWAHHHGREKLGLCYQNKVIIPAGWCENRQASSDWLSSFLKRKKTLSIRTPQVMSLGRAASFNKHNVQTFFSNLAQVYDKHKFQGQDIYNVDETAVTTVQRPTRIVAKKGVKQVGAVTSAERGSLVTMAVAVSAIGNYTSPFFVFARKT